VILRNIKRFTDFGRIRPSIRISRPMMATPIQPLRSKMISVYLCESDLLPPRAHKTDERLHPVVWIVMALAGALLI